MRYSTTTTTRYPSTMSSQKTAGPWVTYSYTYVLCYFSDQECSVIDRENAACRPAGCLVLHEPERLRVLDTTVDSRPRPKAHRSMNSVCPLRLYPSTPNPCHTPFSRRVYETNLHLPRDFRLHRQTEHIVIEASIDLDPAYREIASLAREPHLFHPVEGLHSIKREPNKCDVQPRRSSSKDVHGKEPMFLTPDDK